MRPSLLLPFALSAASQSLYGYGGSYGSSTTSTTTTSVLSPAGYSTSSFITSYGSSSSSLVTAYSSVSGLLNTTVPLGTGSSASTSNASTISPLSTSVSTLANTTVPSGTGSTSGLSLSSSSGSAPLGSGASSSSTAIISSNTTLRGTGGASVITVISGTTDTLVPTTGTDASGSVFTSTITLVPSPSVSPVATSVVDGTTETFIATTGTDSAGIVFTSIVVETTPSVSLVATSVVDGTTETLVATTGTNSAGSVFTSTVAQQTTSSVSPVATSVVDGTTETFVPTTGTDSAGSVFTSTVAETTPSSSSAAITVVSGITETLVTTTGTDSAGSVFTSTVAQETTSSSVSVIITVVSGTTETLIATTATDPAGSIFIGTITEGPTPTTSVIAGLTTYTTFPPSISWSTTSVGSNTHDSSGHPVLGPWPGCWFCPPGSDGFVLSGIGPGIYPGGGNTVAPGSAAPTEIPPAGFPTPFPPLTIDPEGDPTYETSPEPTQPSTSQASSSSSESCADPETATQITYYVSYETGASGSTTATDTYSTYSSQITGCSVTGTVATSATTDTYAYYCTAGCANCVARRDVPAPATAAPLPTATEAAGPSKSVIDFARNLTLFERDIPSKADADGISDLYSTVRAASNTITVPEDQLPLRGISSSRFSYFDASEFNILVTGLRGCTSVVVVSQLGAYATHFWEEPTFRYTGNSATFTADVITYFQTGRAGGEANTQPLATLVQDGVFGDTATTQIYIMTPATRDLDLNPSVPNQAASLTNGDNPALYGPSPPGTVDRIDTITTALNGLLPGVPISQFVYRRQTSGKLLQNGAYGAAMILYSNNQVIDPSDPAEDLPAPQKAVWQTWMQGEMMGQAVWDALPGQTGSCPANQKRQAGSLCSASGTASSTASSSTSSAPASTTSPPTTTSPVTSTTASSAASATFTGTCELDDSDDEYGRCEWVDTTGITEAGSCPESAACPSGGATCYYVDGSGVSCGSSTPASTTACLALRARGKEAPTFATSATCLSSP